MYASQIVEVYPARLNKANILMLKIIKSSNALRLSPAYQKA